MGNGIGEPDSNPGRDCWCFTQIYVLGKGIDLFSLPSSSWTVWLWLSNHSRRKKNFEFKLTLLLINWPGVKPYPWRRGWVNTVTVTSLQKKTVSSIPLKVPIGAHVTTRAISILASPVAYVTNQEAVFVTEKTNIRLVRLLPTLDFDGDDNFIHSIFVLCSTCVISSIGDLHIFKL